MFKIGIIGCGKIAQTRHIPEYYQNSEASFAGFYDLNFKRAKHLAEQFGGKAYNSYEDMLADPEVDAVSVCASNHVHATITIAALKAGKHVLCEKPMAMTLEEGQAMVQTAKETEKFLMIGHNQQLAKAHVKAREMIKNGDIGDVITFKVNFVHSGPENWTIDSNNVWYFDKNRAVIGAMADLGIHKTDLIQFLTGLNIVETTAFIGTLDKRDRNGEFIQVDDNAICIYRLSNGAVGTMTAGWSCYGDEDNSTIIYGSGGVLKIYCDKRYAIVLERKCGERIYYDIDRIQTNDNQTKSGVIDAFIECLRTNTAPIISGEGALTAMKVVFASIESAKTGKAVKICSE